MWLFWTLYALINFSLYYSISVCNMQDIGSNKDCCCCCCCSLTLCSAIQPVVFAAASLLYRTAVISKQSSLPSYGIFRIACQPCVELHCVSLPPLCTQWTNCTLLHLATNPTWPKPFRYWRAVRCLKSVCRKQILPLRQQTYVLVSVIRQS